MFSDQCKEIEANNRMGKPRDLFKKIRDAKGTFHAKMGTIKDRNCMKLKEAEDIKKRWQEYTEELYKKDLHDPDYHNGVTTHLEPDILEYEVKWASGSMLLLLLSRFSRVRLCATPETAAHQAPSSLGFSRQEHWSGLPFPSS